jgi:RNA polymerase sigma factor (sigma-70 family)
MDSDTLLARRLAADLDDAFPTLVEEHRDRLYTIALRQLGDASDAEEVAQDALVRSYRAMAGYSRERRTSLKLRPWLAAICVNLARNRRRRLSDRQPPSPLDDLIEAGFDPAAEASWGPTERAARRESAAEMAELLLQLNPAVRAAVILRHVDGLSVSEVAEALGRPEGTIKAQVSRGLERLRGAIAERDAGRYDARGRPRERPRGEHQRPEPTTPLSPMPGRRAATEVLR